VFTSRRHRPRAISIPCAFHIAGEALAHLSLDPKCGDRNVRLDDFSMVLYHLLRETGGAEVRLVFHSGTEVLSCRRTDAVGEEASCIRVFYSH
jgi:hypothetical protein